MGRPSLLTPQRTARIIELIEGGEYLETVAAGAGVSYTTLNRWRKRGEDLQKLLDSAADDEGHPEHPLWLAHVAQQANEEAKARRQKQPHQARVTKLWRDHPDVEYWQFWKATKEAEALPERDAVLRVRAAGHGGQLIERTTTTTHHPDGRVVVEERERWTAPQWQALMTYMSRRWRPRWAPSATTEVKMADEHKGDDPVEALVHQLATLRAEQQGRLVALKGTATQEVG